MRRLPRHARTAGVACLLTAVVVGGGATVLPAEPDAPGHPAGPAVSLAMFPTDPKPSELAKQKIARTVTLKKRPPPKPTPPPSPAATSAAETPPAPELPPLPADATFTISSFNVLGSSHTRGRGGMAPGPTRIRQAVNLLNIHGVSVAGLQEMQGDQFRAFQSAAGGSFSVYPGLAAGPLGVENSIVWRRSVWGLESARTIQIPYFDGRLRPMPYILLRHLATGRKVWVANFHNPASNPKRGNQDRHRDRAAVLETQLAARLWNETGYPVFVTGDMNDRERYFCRMTAGAPMQAANGGSNVDGCRPPPYPMPVDWIFGSTVVDFSGYVRDEGPLVRRTSDHPMIRATVLLDGSDGLYGD